MEVRSRSAPPPVIDGDRSMQASTLGAERSNNPLWNAASARKKVDQDALLLSNRIRLLRNEEEKTKKKIKETEHKTQEILELRQISEQRRLMRGVEDARRESEQRELRSLHDRDREQHLNRLRENQLQVVNHRAGLSSQVRQERETGQQAAEERRLMLAAEVALKAERVRASAAAVSQSRARYDLSKQDNARSMIQDRILRDEESRRVKAREVEKMEREEVELMARLQRTQERHRQAFLKLEDAIRSGPSGSVGNSVPRSNCRTPILAIEAPSQPSTPGGPGPIDRSADAMVSKAISAGVPGAAAALSSAGPQYPIGGTSKSSVGSRPPRPVRPPMGPAANGATTAERSLKNSQGNTYGCSQFISEPSRLTSRTRSSSLGCGRSLSRDAVIAPTMPAKKGAPSLSNCSTAVGSIAGGPAIGSGAERSGNSTPSSEKQNMISYTTVDGTQLDLSIEDDLDLAALLNA